MIVICLDKFRKSEGSRLCLCTYVTSNSMFGDAVSSECTGTSCSMFCVEVSNECTVPSCSMFCVAVSNECTGDIMLNGVSHYLFPFILEFSLIGKIPQLFISSSKIRYLITGKI